MRYINTLVEGETIRNIYLCKGKRSAETRNGKPYDNLILQDKTGTLDGKVWDPNSNGIADYDEMDFIEVFGDVISYNNNLQLNIRQIRKAYEDEYVAADYMPTTEKSTDSMFEELIGYVKKIDNDYLRQAVEYYFVNDEAFIKTFSRTFRSKDRSSWICRRTSGTYIKRRENVRIHGECISDSQQRSAIRCSHLSRYRKDKRIVTVPDK